MLETPAFPRSPLSRLPSDRLFTAAALAARLGSAASNALIRMRAASERKAARRDAFARSLSEAGWKLLVPLTGGLPLAAIVLRGAGTYGVGMRDDDTWSDAQQRHLLGVCREDDLRGLVLLGRPAFGDRALSGVEFVESDIPARRPVAEPVVESQDSGWARLSFHEIHMT